MTVIDKELFRKRVDSLSVRVAAENDSTIVGMLRPRVVDFDADELRLTLAFPAAAWEENAGGVIHGGITALMMDSAMGILAYAISGGMCPTMNLNISYPRPTPGGGTLIARAKAVMTGRSTLYLSAELWDERAPDKITVTASGVFHDLHQPLFQKVDTAETLGQAAPDPAAQ